MNYRPSHGQHGNVSGVSNDRFILTVNNRRMLCPSSNHRKHLRKGNNMDKEKIHEFCRSFMSDDQGNLNDNHFQILHEEQDEITVRFFTTDAGESLYNGFAHQTYNTTLALCALADGLHVYCAHPEDDDVRLFQSDEIEESEGHMFIIIRG